MKYLINEYDARLELGGDGEERGHKLRGLAVPLAGHVRLLNVCTATQHQLTAIFHTYAHTSAHTQSTY